MRIIGFGDCYLGWIEAHRIYFTRNGVKMCFQFALRALPISAEHRERRK